MTVWMQGGEKGREADRPRLRGVLAPVLTPFRADLSPDAARFVPNKCRRGWDGKLMGTTSAKPAHLLSALDRLFRKPLELRIVANRRQGGIGQDFVLPEGGALLRG